MDGGERGSGVGNRVNDTPRDRAYSRKSSPCPPGLRALDHSATMSLLFRKTCPPSLSDILHQFRILLLRHELPLQRSYSSVWLLLSPRCASYQYPLVLVPLLGILLAILREDLS